MNKSQYFTLLLFCC